MGRQSTKSTVPSKAKIPSGFPPACDPGRPHALAKSTPTGKMSMPPTKRATTALAVEMFMATSPATSHAPAEAHTPGAPEKYANRMFCCASATVQEEVDMEPV